MTTPDTREFAYEVLIVSNSGADSTEPVSLTSAAAVRVAYLPAEFRCDPGVHELLFTNGELRPVVIMNPPPNAPDGRMRVRWTSPDPLVPAELVPPRE